MSRPEYCTIIPGHFWNYLGCSFSSEFAFSGCLFQWDKLGWQLAGPKFKLLLKKQICHETGPQQRPRAENKLIRLRITLPRNIPFFTLVLPLCMLFLCVSRIKSMDHRDLLTLVAALVQDVLEVLHQQLGHGFGLNSNRPERLFVIIEYDQAGLDVLVSLLGAHKRVVATHRYSLLLTPAGSHKCGASLAFPARQWAHHERYSKCSG